MKLYIRDKVGNTITRELSGINVDVTAPTFTLSAVPSGWTKNNVTVTLSAQNDIGSGIKSGYPKYSLSGAQTLAATNGTSVTVSAEGQTEVTFVLSDKVGNTKTVSKTVKIDKSAPVLSLSAVSGDYTKNDVTVSVTEAKDIGGAGIASGYPKYSASGAQTISERSGSSASISAEGQTLLTFVLTDTAGNSTSVSRTVKIDKTPPQISAPVPSGWINSGYTVSASATDALSTVNTGSWKNSIDGVNFSSASSANNKYGFDGEGTHKVYFKVSDKAGNETPVGFPATVKIDKTPPSLTITANTSAWTKGPIILTAAATDTRSGVKSGSYEHSTDGVNWLPGASMSMSANGTGWFRVSDNAGNLPE